MKPPGLGTAARLAAVLLAAALVPGCARHDASAASDGALRIVVPTGAMSWILPYIADTDGSFRNHGISATITVAGSGPLDIDAVLGGSADVGFNVLNLVEQAQAQGRDLVAFGRVFRHWSGQLVVSRSVASRLHLAAMPSLTDRGRALKGMTIGVVCPATGDDALLRMTLQQAGLSPDSDVTITPIKDAAATIGALAAGHIDAFLRATPDAEVAVARGIASTVANFTDAGQEGLMAGTLVASRGWLAAHGALARRLIAALDQAAADLAAHPAAIGRELRARFPGLSDAVFNTVFAETRQLADDPIAPITRQDFQANLALLPAADAPRLEYSSVVDNSHV